MTVFYAEGGYQLNTAVAGAAFSEVLADSRLGRIWIIQSEQEDVGHVVLTFKYAMEYGGVIACVDDLYIQAAYRNRGLGTVALVEVKEFCLSAGICALTVEVAYDNAPAQAVYRRVGFTDVADRQLLALGLAPPAHVI